MATSPTSTPNAPADGTGAPAETGVRARTRRAILEAAVEVLSTAKSASLGDVAQAARVGRSTLHRYFPERGDLITALGNEAVERTRAAIRAARVDDGDPADALRRVAYEYYELGPWYMVLFNEHGTAGEETDESFWDDADAAEEPVRELLRRGQEAGAFDSELTVAWIQRTMWWLLFNAWSAAAEGEVSRGEALRMAVRSIEGVTFARGARP